MIIKISSKKQITIPKNIADAFNLKRGDVIEIAKIKNHIVMTPKEVLYEDKYPQEDLKSAERVLSKKNPKKEVSYKSGDAMISAFKKRVKK